jgi:hypothetical protein
VGNQRMGRIPASVGQSFLVFLVVLAGLWLPGKAVANSGGAAADIPAATSLAQQMTASAEKTGGAALASAQDTARQAMSQAAGTSSEAIQGAQQTADAALAQARKAVSAAEAEAESGATSASPPGSSSSSGGSPSAGTGSSSSGAGSSGSGAGSSSSAGSTGLGLGNSAGTAGRSSGTDLPPVSVPGSLSAAIPDARAESAVATAAAEAATGQALSTAAAAARVDWRGQADSVSHGLASVSEDTGRAPSSTWRHERQAPPRPDALPGPGGRSAWPPALPTQHQPLGTRDITPPPGSPVHTSFSRSAEDAAPQAPTRDATASTPPPPSWFGPASSGSAAAAGSGGGAGSSAGVLVGALIAILVAASSGRLSLDLLPPRSMLAASPLERPG